MDEKFYVTIMNEYYSFKDRLEKRVKNSTFSCKYEDYYLIDENWYNKLENVLKIIKHLKNQMKIRIFQKMTFPCPRGTLNSSTTSPS